MKVKFSKFERVAGIFVLMAMVGCVAAGVFVAIQKGWFERKIELRTTFDSASGLTPGTQVQMSGLRVGSVDSVELLSDTQVMVTFNVSQRHFSKIKKDSVVRTIRPFLIGDKVLEVSVGSEGSGHVQPGGLIAAESSMDLMDLLGGRQLGDALKEMGTLMSSVRTLFQAFADPKRASALVQMFDQLLPLVTHANRMAIEMTTLGKQVNRKKNMQRIVENMIVMTNTLNSAMPQIQEMIASSPHLARDIGSIVENLASLTNEMNKLFPALAEIAPELPRASRRAIEAMNEAVIVLKAMQKSFLLRSSAEEVREEEAAAAAASEAEKARAPASEGANDKE